MKFKLLICYQGRLVSTVENIRIETLNMLLWLEEDTAQGDPCWHFEIGPYCEFEGRLIL